MKQVSFLLDKHRRDMWVDREGDVWFYDAPGAHWQILGGNDCGNGYDQYNEHDDLDFFPASKYGPYTRIHKGPR